MFHVSYLSKLCDTGLLMLETISFTGGKNDEIKRYYYSNEDFIENQTVNKFYCSNCRRSKELKAHQFSNCSNV